MAVLSLFITHISIGQNHGKGQLNVVQDARIDSLLVKYIEINKVNPGIEGWRIEIFFEAGNNSKTMAMEARSGFIGKYTNVSSYLLFQQPYYKVRVGDFRSKVEAEKFLKDIEPDYPNAFVVADEINFPKLEQEQP